MISGSAAGTNDLEHDPPARTAEDPCPISNSEFDTWETPAWVSMMTTQTENRNTVAMTVAPPDAPKGASEPGTTAVSGADRKRVDPDRQQLVRAPAQTHHDGPPGFPP